MASTAVILAFPAASPSSPLAPSLPPPSVPAIKIQLYRHGALNSARPLPPPNLRRPSFLRRIAGGVADHGAAVAGRVDEAAGLLDRHRRAALLLAGAGRGEQECVAAAVDIPGDNRRDHHAAAAARGGGAPRPRRGRADKDAAFRRRLLGLQRPHPLAHRPRLLLCEGVHQDRTGQPGGVPVRLPLRRLLPRARVQPGVQRGPPRSGDTVRLRPGRRHLPPARQGAVRGVREQRRGRDGAKAQLGSWLILTCFQTSVISSSMFLTAMAANPLSANLTLNTIKQTIGWTDWAVAAIVPGLASLVVVPLLLYVIYPPAVKTSPDAPKLARERLEKMGPMTKNEIIMAGTLLLTV